MGGSCSSYENLERGISLDEVLTRARTGDIILFSGNGAFSDIVRFGSESEFSHVGIVIRINQHAAPILFQSTFDVQPFDLESKTYKTGPKVSLLHLSIKYYDGYKIYYRQLKTGLKGKEAGAKRQEWTDILLKFQTKVNHLPYEVNLGELTNSALGISRENDRSSYFCTELVADCWVELGFLPPDTLVNSFTMDNFTSKTPVILNGHEYYEEEVRIGF